jgi:hypothetical protein
MVTIRHSLPTLLLAALVLAVTVSQPSTTLGQSDVDNSFQPVVVAGAQVGALLGMPVTELFVYSYSDGAWTQIPYQIDEKTPNENGDRVYTAEGDGRLDADEEIVFMLKDMGGQAPPPAWVEGAETDSRIEVAAQASGGSRRWAYLFHGPQLSQTFEADYVRFSGAAQRVIAEHYQAGFLDNGTGLNELRLNNSGVDILDRTKLRLEIVVRVFGIPVRRLSCNEDNLTQEDGCGLEPKPISPVKDGPVRLVWSEGGGFVYGSLFQTQNEVDLSALPGIASATIESFRFSWDFAEQGVATSTPTTYLDANMSGPVVIDGQPDTVPTQSVPAWRQISHATGTIIMTTDLSAAGGTQRNYYKDDSTFDPDDTGDGLSYGDNGFSIDNPNTSFTLETSLLVLPPTEDNVGAAYAEQLATLPAVIVTLQTPAGPPGRKVFLPFIRH